MPARSRLREIQAEWNALVPQATGLSRVRIWNQVPANVREGETRLEWLKAQLQSRVSSFDLTFGIEIEAFLPRGTLRQDLRLSLAEAGIDARVEDLNHHTRDYWKLTTDGSLGDYTHGVETVSPILVGDEGFGNLRRVCDTLTALGARIRRNCGLHVHIGVNGRDVQFFKNLFKLYSRFEVVIDSFMSPSRRANENQYCSRVPFTAAMDNATTLNELRDAYGRGSWARYRKLNLEAYWTHGTVEFRQHQGTTDATKTEMWARLCMRMVNAAANADMAERLAPARRSDQTFDTFMDTIGASDSERQYFARRRAEFARR